MSSHGGMISGKDLNGVSSDAGVTNNALHVFSSARTAALVIPNDGGTHNYMALYIGTAQTTLKVTMAGDGAAVSFTNVPAGSLLPIQITRVWNTGTSPGGAGIIGLNW